MRVPGDTLAKLSNLSKLLVPSVRNNHLVRDEFNCELDEVIGEVKIGEIKMVVNALNYERVLDKEWRLLLPSISLQFPVISSPMTPAPAQLLSSNIKKSIFSFL